MEFNLEQNDNIEAIRQMFNIMISEISSLREDVRLLTTQVNLLTNNIRPSETTRRTVLSINFVKISSEEQLVNFNRDLLEESYRIKIQDWLGNAVTETLSNNRMLQALDFIFEKSFLCSCSWTGLSTVNISKVAMRTYRNVINLFKHIACTRTVEADDAMVADFFKNKLRHAKERMAAKGIRKSSCHTVQKRL